MQIRTDFLATRGATQRECAQPCNIPSSLGSLWKECTGAMHSCCLATELKQPHLGGRGRREALQTQEAKVSKNLKESSGPFPRLHKRHPQPRLPFEFLGQCVMKHRLSPKDDLELLTSCLHQVLGFWNAPRNRKQSFVVAEKHPTKPTKPQPSSRQFTNHLLPIPSSFSLPNICLLCSLLAPDHKYDYEPSTPRPLC